MTIRKPLLFLFFGLLAACSDGGSKGKSNETIIINSASPCEDFSGEYDGRSTQDGSDCGWEDGDDATTIFVSQVNCDVEVEVEDIVFEGSVDGGVVTLSGSFEEDGAQFSLASNSLSLDGDRLHGDLQFDVETDGEECRYTIGLDVTRMSTPPVNVATNSSQTNGMPNSVTEGEPATLEAQAVGFWATVGSNCASGGSLSSGYAYTLCPGGRIRGGGELGNTTELVCGNFDTSARTLENCDDQVGCFDKIHATYRSTLILGGQSDVDPAAERTFYVISRDQIAQLTACGDDSTGLLFMDRVPGDAADHDCVSSACPADGTSSDGGYGTCGTDCDCGRCWYCDKSGGSSTCRYGGEGEFGCYRGCGW